jgi:hypothetical protein
VFARAARPPRRLRLAASVAAMARAIALGAVALLPACSSDDTSVSLGSQSWGTYTVAVESRPAPPRPGSNEIVIQVSGEKHRPVYDALVFVRTAPTAEWTQAIEDGHVGVYRRAVRFARGGNASLEVLLRRNGEESTLVFPVNVSGAS